MILYHASPNQGLKILDSEKTMSTHLKTLKKYVYASDDKSYVAGFSFNWNSRDGIRFGKERDEDPWKIEIPKRHLHRLKNKCSIYTVDSTRFKKVKGVTTPEYYNKEKVIIKSEEKYKSALDCLKKNNVKIKVL